jgi:hypothetical protein
VDRLVVYLRYADKDFGLLASRLRGIYQPVISTQNPFRSIYSGL